MSGMAAALSEAQGEVSTLRHELAEQKERHKHMEGRMQAAMDAKSVAAAELREHKFRLENAERWAGQGPVPPGADGTQSLNPHRQAGFLVPGPQLV